MSPIVEILSPILETLLADAEMLSPIGEILSLIREILSSNFGEALSRERGEFQLLYVGTREGIWTIRIEGSCASQNTALIKSMIN